MNKNKLSQALEPFFQQIGGLSRLYRILICVATVVIVVAAFGFGLYKPKLDRMAVLQKNINTTEQRLETVKISASEYDKYQALMEDAKAQFARVSRELPLTEEIPSLLTEISKAGNASGLKFLLFQPQAERRKDFYAEIPIRMELLGGYHDLGNFSDRLARLSRIVNIDNCSTQGSGSALKITCTAITYRFVGEQASQNQQEK